MALRITTFEPATPPRRRCTRRRAPALERIDRRRRRRDPRASDPQDLAQIFAELAGWDDPHRAFQARRQLVELVVRRRRALAARRAWLPLYVVVDRASCSTRSPRTRASRCCSTTPASCSTSCGETAAAERSSRPPAGSTPTSSTSRANLQGRSHAPRRAAATAAGSWAATATRPARSPPAPARSPRSAPPRTGSTLSLCMIVKDEEELLPGCLEAARDARRRDRHRRHRLDRPHRRDRRVVRREGHRRSRGTARSPTRATSRSTHATGDWIMYLDADEHLVPEDAPQLRALLGRTWREALLPRRDELHRRRRLRRRGRPPRAAHLPQPPRVPLRGPHPRAEDADACRPTCPSGSRRRRSGSAHYGYLKSRINAQGEVAPQHRAARARGARSRRARSTTFNLGSEYLALGELGQAPRALRPRLGRCCSREADWQSAGYAPMLVSRAVTARREAGDLAGARDARRRGARGLSRTTPTSSSSSRSAPQDEGDLDEAARARRALPRARRRARQVRGHRRLRHLPRARACSPRSRAGQATPLDAEELYRRSLAEHPDVRRARAPARHADADARRDARARSPRAVPSDRPSAMLLLAHRLLRGRPLGRRRALVPRRARARSPPTASPGSGSSRRCSRSSATTRRPPRPRSSRADSPLAAPPPARAAVRATAPPATPPPCATAVARAAATSWPTAELALFARLGRRRSTAPSPPSSLPAACGSSR